LSFKFYRLLFTRLFGREEFNAPLDDPFIFYRPFNLASLFNLLVVKLPLYIACIVGIIYVNWGYQLLITCIELLIIEIIMLILMTLEYFMFR